MLRRLGSHVRNQWIGVLALFIALATGTAYAANEWTGENIVDGSLTSADYRNNDIHGRDILDGSLASADYRNNDIRGGDVLDNSLTGADVADNSLTGTDVNESSLNLAAEGWHEVGASGEPPFNDNRPTTSCFWKNYDGGVSHNSAAFLRDRHGFVHLKGLVDAEGECRTSYPQLRRIFTLPEGYRPAKREIQIAIGSPSEIVRINVNGPAAFSQPAGAVEYDPQSTGISGQWVSLDGITFRCAPSGQNGCP